MEKRLVEKRELLKNIEYENSLMMNYQPRHHQRILTVDELQLGYDKALFTPLSFELKRGERLVIQGGNGYVSLQYYNICLESLMVTRQVQSLNLAD